MGQRKTTSHFPGNETFVTAANSSPADSPTTAWSEKDGNRSPTVSIGDLLMSWFRRTLALENVYVMGVVVHDRTCRRPGSGSLVGLARRLTPAAQDHLVVPDLE